MDHTYIMNDSNRSSGMIMIEDLGTNKILSNDRLILDDLGTIDESFAKK